MDLNPEHYGSLCKVLAYLQKNSKDVIAVYSLKGSFQYATYYNPDGFLISYYTDDDGSVFSVILQQNTVLRVFSKDNSGYDHIINGNQIEKGVTLDVNERGKRWEGDSYKGLPYGWGTLWDEGNNIKFRGFMFGDRYYGYGTLYASGLLTKEYEGDWCNGKRHGKGTLYNRQEDVVYSGVYVNDDTAQEPSIHVTKQKELGIITNVVETILIDNLCCRNVYNFNLVSLPNLTSIKVGRGCFSDSEYKRYSQFHKANEEEEKRFGSFSIRSCPVLETIQIIVESFNNMLSCEISDLPTLRVLLICDSCFIKCQRFILSSNISFN